jgi:AraC-like DNA-binding protein
VQGLVGYAGPLLTDQTRTIFGDPTAVPTSIGLAAHLAVAHLERHHIDPGPLLARSGLSRVALATRQRVKVKSVIDFLERVSGAVEDDWLGLTLAADFDLREIGVLYYVAASSERFGDALKRLDRYVRIADEALVMRIVQGSVCRVGLFYVGVPRHADRHLMESLAVLLLRLCRQLVGKKIVPLAASFAHHRSDGRKMEQILGCDVSFDAYEDAISFDAAVMDLPLLGYDPYLNELMVKSCEDAIATRPTNVSPFRTVVENTIAPLLPHAEAQVKTVAGRIGLSERTFARRLTAEGLSFGEILDQLRRDLAVRYLGENLQASQIAWLLGFQQPSAFSHACRRWTGKSPSEFRRSQAPSLSPA